MAVSCVKELFTVSLVPTTFTILKKCYYGPYGWNDKKGQPLTPTEWGNLLLSPDSEIPSSIKEAQDLLFSTDMKPPKDIIIHPLEEESIPILSLSSIPKTYSSKTLIEEIGIENFEPPKSNSSKALIEEIGIEPEKLLIQEIGADELQITNINTSLIKPEFTVQNVNGRIDVTIILPGIVS